VEVWDLIIDPANDPLWCRKVKSVAQIAPGRWTVVHKPVPLRPAVELTVEHLISEAPSRLTMREEDDVSIFKVEYRLHPSGIGTSLTQVSEAEWKKLPPFLHPVFARGVDRDVRDQLACLKTLLEGRSPGSH
jgi:hypothetical protein